MLRLLTLLLAIAALAFAWSWLQVDPAAPTTGGSQTAATGNTSSATTTTPALTASEREQAIAGAAEETDGPDDARATFSLHGRCVHAITGEPLGECTVAMRSETGEDTVSGPWSDAPQQLVTADDGAFELQTTHDAWTDTLVLRCSRDGFAPRTGRWQQPDDGAEIDLGDIKMLPAIDVDGIVVDPQGAPVEGVRMLFAYIRLSGDEPTDTANMLRVTSDAAGRFRFAEPAHPGEWYIGAEDTGALVEPRSVKLDDTSTFHLRVVVERPDPKFSITGTITDTSGTPLADCRLSATGDGFIGRGSSNARGEFEIRRAGPMPARGEPGARLSCSTPNRSHERIQPPLDERVAWGTSGVQIVMRKRTTQPVRIVTAQGEAVPDYTLFVFRGRDQLASLPSQTKRGHHDQGRCLLDNLNAAPHTVIAVPRAEHLANSGKVTFDVPAQSNPAEQLVTVPQRVPTQVLVRHEDGRAAAQSTVELLLPLADDNANPNTRYEPLHRLGRGGRWPSHAVVVTGTTDPEGLAQLMAPPGAFVLRVRGEQHTPLLQPAEIFAPSGSLRATVTSAAILHGTLQPADAVAKLQAFSRIGSEPVAIQLTSKNPSTKHTAVVDEHGSFQLGGLAAGDYDVVLTYWLRSSTVNVGTVSISLDPITMRTGERQQRTIDIAAQIPSTVTGRVLINGEPLADVHCFLRRTGPGKHVIRRVATDREGRYRGLVPPGDYGFAITLAAQPGPGWHHIVLPDQWQLAAGTEHVANFDVPLRRVRLRVLDEQEQPVAGRRVRVSRSGFFLHGSLQTDGDGYVDIHPAPLEPFVLEVTTDSGKRRTESIELPPGRDDLERSVRLP